MLLSEADSDLFYTLWRPMLHAANLQEKMFPGLNIIKAARLNPEQMAKISRWIWKNPPFIDQYLEKNPSLPADHREIISGWKRNYYGTWIVERYLKSGTVFIGSNNTVLLVQGLKSTYEEMFGYWGLPVGIRATVLPFRNKIITDGLVEVLPVQMGPGIRRNMKEIYSEARQKKQVFSSFTDEAFASLSDAQLPVER